MSSELPLPVALFFHTYNHILFKHATLSFNNSRVYVPLLGYAYMTRQLMKVANGQILLALEGGLVALVMFS